jgi:Yip1 domain
MDLSGVNPRKSLVDRAKAIILSPKDEWPVIAAEPATIGDIVKGYVLPLAAIGPVASFIGGQVFGYGAFGVTFRPGLVAGISTMVVSFALAVAMIFALMFIVDLLAPKFGGVSNRLNAFKLVAYGATASWLAGVFGLVPALGVFGLLGLYSVYLFYTGATPLMQVPQDKSAGFIAVTILCAIVAAILIAPITALITGMWGASTAASSYDAGKVSGTVNLPGGGSVDLGKIEQMGKQAEAAANGKAAPAVDMGKMQALLPASVGSYARTATESTAMGAVGSTAEGTYTAGEKSFRLRVTDMSAMGAIAGMVGAMGVEQSREDADSYERTGTVDGQMQTEEWNKTSNSGKFGRMVANRFMVEAEGSAASIDELKAAVATIDPDDLTELVD